MPHPATSETYTLSYTTLFRSAPTAAIRRVGAGAPADAREKGCADGGLCQRSEIRQQRSDLPRSGVCGNPEERRSEEHTSELQSLRHLVCRLLLEKKKQPNTRL